MVNQLAAAHERGVISKGSKVFLTIHWPVAETEGGSAVIKMRVTRQGNKDFVDFDENNMIVKNIDNSFI